MPVTPMGVRYQRWRMVTRSVSSMAGVVITDNRMGTAATLTITEIKINKVNSLGLATLSINCPAQIPASKMAV